MARLLTSGAFAQVARLSPKALRLYDELGLLATGSGGRRVRIPVLRSGAAGAGPVDRLTSAAGHAVGADPVDRGLGHSAGLVGDLLAH
ncbi:hypothetical protein [Nonomuraea roseola]|uniref:HTH merR-type domain-containing protein n=1 Tax=Nonomuraea roseola TaxID=46179 RepID=A0ABV5Q8Q6_9ACTN